MEKDNKKIHVSAIDIYLKPTYDCTDTYHANKVNNELDRIQNNGGIVIGIETHKLEFNDGMTDPKLRTIITYKI